MMQALAGSSYLVMIDPVPPAAAPLDVIILWTFVIEGV